MFDMKMDDLNVRYEMDDLNVRVSINEEDLLKV